MIEIEGMKFYAFHGAIKEEATIGGYFEVDVTYDFPMEKVFLSDSVDKTISYADVYNFIKTEMDTPAQLIETVANRIMSRLKFEFPQLTYLKVKVSKMNPPLGGEVQRAAVTLNEKW